MKKINLFRNSLLLMFFVLAGANESSAQNCNSFTLTRDSITNPGTYTVASITESDGLRNGPDYSGATLYYPTNATPPFASIVIVPGYLSPQSSIQTWGPFLASHGIVTMTIGTNSVFDDPNERKDALLDAIISLSQEQTRTGSPLLGNLDLNSIAVGGWSMGGGGAQLAAAADTTLKAVMGLCPWLDGQTTAADLNHPVPLLIFSGEFDPTAPPASHANVHYGYTPATTPKLVYEIDNGGHLVANNPTGGQGEIGQIAVAWLQKYLLGDSCYCPLLLDTPSTASHYMTNVTCPVNTSVHAINGQNNFSCSLYPNPSQGMLNLEFSSLKEEVQYDVFSLTGQNLLSGTFYQQIASLDIHHLASGTYVIRLTSAKETEEVKFVKW